jgi:hypothetical protein
MSILDSWFTHVPYILNEQSNMKSMRVVLPFPSLPKSVPFLSIPGCALNKAGAKRKMKAQKILIFNFKSV